VEGAKKILVADRNRHVRDFLRRELTAEGYLVLVAKDGREVQEFLQGRTPPDLIILDPEIPFLEVLAAPETPQEDKPRIPMILHFFGEDQVLGTRLAGVVACLEKSADPARLKQLLAEVLGHGGRRPPRDGPEKAEPR